MLREPVECMDGTLDYGGIVAPCTGRGGEKRQIDNMPDDYEPPETLYGNFTNRNIKLFIGALIIGFLIYKYNKK